MLSRYPSEAALLGVYFEEWVSRRGEEATKLPDNSGEGWHTDLVLDDDDE